MNVKAEFTSLLSNLRSNSVPLAMDRHCIFVFFMAKKPVFQNHIKRTTTDTESTLTLLNRRIFLLQTLIFPYSHNYYVFSLLSSFCGLAAPLNWLRHAFFSHLAITIAERNDSLPNCAHIHCLISKPWARISGFNLFFSSLNELQYYPSV